MFLFHLFFVCVRKKALERAERKAARKAEAAKKSTATEPAATTSGEVDCTLNSDVLNPLLDLPRQRENNQIRGSDEDVGLNIIKLPSLELISHGLIILIDGTQPVAELNLYRRTLFTPL